MIAKPKLIGWAARMAADYAITNRNTLAGLPVREQVQRISTAHERNAQKAADTGDTVHSLIECWATGQPFPATGVDAQANRLIDFMLDSRPEFLENECTMWSRSHGYAGTADFIARIDGRTLLCDLKTGKNLHDEVGLQLAALAGADFIIREDGTEDPLPQIDGLAALHVRPRSWSLVEIRYSENCFQAFLSALDLWYWQRNTAPGVLSGR
jgi:hypothetical protein